MPNTAPTRDQVEQRNSNPTVLIAGGAGFIGSHLIETLLSQNFKVICVDNFSTGKKDNLKAVLTAPNFSLIEADIGDPKFNLPEGVKIDYCFHLASIEDYLQKGLSLDTLLVNSLGTKQLLEISKQQQAKFILVSAADLYSGAIATSSLRYYFGKTPAQEAILSTHEAKRFSEALCFEYFKKYKVPLTIVRLKDVYGPRMDLERGDDISNLLFQALNKKTLEIPGDGLTIINPTFVSDVIFGLIKAAMGDYSGEIFILVNPEKITLESFAQTVKLVAGPLELEHKKTSDSLDFGSQHFDLENTVEKLAWKPKVALAEGISSVIHQVRQEESKKERTKAEEAPTEEPTEQPEQLAASKGVKRGGGKNWLRIVVFFTAAALLVVTILYPLVGFSVSSYLGKNKLEEAYQLSLAEKNENAIGKAFSAQKSFQGSLEALNNLNWLIKIIGLTDKSSATSDILSSAEDLSEAIRSSSRGNQVLLTAADQKLTPEQAVARLNEALDNLYAAEDSLEQSKVGFEQISWPGLPQAILPTKDFMTKTRDSLEVQVQELINTIEQNLVKIPANE